MSQDPLQNEPLFATLRQSSETAARVVVSAEQMREIEGRMFAAGMPVAALMEKVAGSIAREIMSLYPKSRGDRAGILAGPGHNGGDAFVVARELFLQGYDISIYAPFDRCKELTVSHAKYAISLGIPCHTRVESLSDRHFLIDGLFGFGLTREITGEVARSLHWLNETNKPIISIDLPSGIHTDTGEVLGTAIRATHTFCLGLWKLAFFQDRALEYFGKASLLEFGIPVADVKAILSENPPIQRLAKAVALAVLPRKRPLVTHKYKQGHLLLVCGSRRYAGGAILTGLGARASGAGMLSIAVPESLRLLLVSHLPEALIIGCPETETGAIADLPLEDLTAFDAIACGPGLTREPKSLIERVLQVPKPLILDADGLNIIAGMEAISLLSQRDFPTILTPHLGEFKRLFPDIPAENFLVAVGEAAKQSGAIVLLKGSRTAIASPDGTIWIVPESTPALARGGSGDVLTGLMGGLIAGLASSGKPLELVTATAAWWHARGGILAAKERTELGVDAFTLTQFLSQCLLEDELIVDS
ncbi:MAG: NAD(P)H-hydrate dehydratase [Cyanobacteria bacterium SBLK]|nr:NAD(P)H-hydrate dehydratase [Cyanobacteria bacterium SBLK]